MQLRVIFIFFALFIAAEKIMADEKFKFLHLTCIPDASYMEIMPSQLMNIGGYDTETYKNKYGLFPEGKGEIECDIGKDVRVEYLSTYPRATGMCGAGTNSVLNIYIDNKLVAKDVVFNADCFDSGTTGISIQDQNYFLVLSLLMHPKTGSNPIGPKTIYRDNFIINLTKDEFLTNKSQALPITMKHIESRVQEFTPK